MFPNFDSCQFLEERSGPNFDMKPFINNLAFWRGHYLTSPNKYDKTHFIQKTVYSPRS